MFKIFGWLKRLSTLSTKFYIVAGVACFGVAIIVAGAAIWQLGLFTSGEEVIPTPTKIMAKLSVTVPAGTAPTGKETPRPTAITTPTVTPTIKPSPIPTVVKAITPVILRNAPKAPEVILIEAPIGGKDVPVFGPLHLSVIALVATFVLLLFMEAKERAQVGDFWSVFVGGLFNLLTIIPNFSSFLKGLGFEKIITTFFWGIVIGTAGAGGIDFTHPAGYLVIIASAGFILGELGDIGKVISVSSGKIYTLNQTIILIQNKMMGEALLSTVVLGMLLMGTILFAIELMRSKAPRGFLVGGLSILSYFGTKKLLISVEVSQSILNNLWFVPIGIGIAVAFLAAFLIVQVPAIQKLLPTGTGGDISRTGVARKPHLGLTFDSILFVIALGITAFVAIG